MDGEERVRARRAGRFPFREPCLALPLSAFKIFGNGRWGGAGRDDGLALGSLIINGLGYQLDGIELAEDLPLLLRWADCKSESSPWADTVRLMG